MYEGTSILDKTPPPPPSLKLIATFDVQKNKWHYRKKAQSNVSTETTQLESGESFTRVLQTLCSLGTEQILEIGGTNLRHAWPEPHILTTIHLHPSQSWYRSMHLCKWEPSKLVAPSLLPGPCTMWSVSSVSTFQDKRLRTQKSTPVQPSIHPGRKTQHPFSTRSTQDAKVNTRSAIDPPRPVQPSIHPGRKIRHPFNPQIRPFPVSGPPLIKHPAFEPWIQRLKRCIYIYIYIYSCSGNLFWRDAVKRNIC